MGFLLFFGKKFRGFGRLQLLFFVDHSTPSHCPIVMFSSRKRQDVKDRRHPDWVTIH